MSIWNGLLFLQGHVASPRLALALAGAEPVPAPAPAPPPLHDDAHRRPAAAACG
ncbi:hypothetical protein [Luteimonas sp. R10]|uniref:hypothetical protein n=1 Tax=Luteimonas sp. R10 TaxID=3108176 RepID=UPI0030911CF3|nr:hypothetical protein U3649_02820 [Luteimonas sp. R10]